MILPLSLAPARNEVSLFLSVPMSVIVTFSPEIVNTAPLTAPTSIFFLLMAATGAPLPVRVKLPVLLISIFLLAPSAVTALNAVLALLATSAGKPIASPSANSYLVVSPTILLILLYPFSLPVIQVSYSVAPPNLQTFVNSKLKSIAFSKCFLFNILIPILIYSSASALSIFSHRRH